MPEYTEKCPYCGFDAVHYPSSGIVYAGRDFGPVWVCSRYPTCDAYVGCHKDGDGKRPLGRLADKALRQAKMRAHAAFDPLWKELGLRRRKAYAKLADALGIPVDDCHIGMFDEAMCARVVAVCGQLRQNALVAMDFATGKEGR